MRRRATSSPELVTHLGARDWIAMQRSATELAEPRPHVVHDHATILVYLEGRARFWMRGLYELGPGDLLLIPAGLAHYFVAAHEVRSIGVSLRVADDTVSAAAQLIALFDGVRRGGCASRHLAPAARTPLERVFLELERELAQPGVATELALDAYVSLLTASIVRAAPGVEATRSSSSPVVARARARASPSLRGDFAARRREARRALARSRRVAGQRRDRRDRGGLDHPRTHERGAPAALADGRERRERRRALRVRQPLALLSRVQARARNDTGRVATRTSSSVNDLEAIMWNERYAETFAAYGTEPNDFLREVADRIPPGPVLCLAEGEGRNAVFLAARGHAVTAVDWSEVGLANATRLAKGRGVTLRTVHADLRDYDLGEARWAAILSIWAHVPPDLRVRLHAACVRALRPGGALILEAYTPRQLDRPGRGGPTQVELLMTPSALREELAGLRFERCEEIDREIEEGQYHRGPSTTVQVLAFK